MPLLDNNKQITSLVNNGATDDDEPFLSPLPKLSLKKQDSKISVINRDGLSWPSDGTFEQTWSDFSSVTFDAILLYAESINASDVHISADYPVMFRIDGTLKPVFSDFKLTQENVEKFFSEVLTQNLLDDLKKDLDVDFSFTLSSNNRVRANIYNKQGKLGGAFRLLPSSIKTIAELNLPSIMYQLTELPQGLILLTGPTGSGKSTTIAAMINEINSNRSEHIITLEDPVEYVYPKMKSLVNQREIGSDAASFERGLREILRQDPDVVLVGEMRDFETIAATITIAETGHLVFSTLHTNSAAQTIDRIIDVFPQAQQSQVRAQLASSLGAVVSQRLVPRIGGGREAVLEILLATPAIKNAIRDNKTYQIDNIIATSLESGMTSLENSLAKSVRQGTIDLEIAKKYTLKPEELLNLLSN